MCLCFFFLPKARRLSNSSLLCLLRLNWRQSSEECGLIANKEVILQRNRPQFPPHRFKEEFERIKDVCRRLSGCRSQVPHGDVRAPRFPAFTKAWPPTRFFKCAGFSLFCRSLRMKCQKKLGLNRANSPAGSDQTSVNGRGLVSQPTTRNHLLSCQAQQINLRFDKGGIRGTSL